ncbi:autotransporter outer membrane beta-barrel domain-containing protein [Bartonella rattimassiliensis]|uniref:autotransporter outer membrane beta-barrel domain-containing protein n=1 Tax=Bartonella rattimassiliensis TaxID=270250 RepID=UPI00036FFB73|nr:autotransporter outer membrane beta-barrel domain-containing protein [Bartonella rattimassiliensis]
MFFFLVVSINASFHVFAASCDATESFYKCDDGKQHTIGNKTYNLKNLQKHTFGFAPIYVEKAGTVVDASQITVTGDKSGGISTYGAYAKYGAHLNLKDSNFKNVQALHAENAVIRMRGGSITGSSHAIYALGQSADISLVGVNIVIEPHNLQDVGFVSRLGAKINMVASIVNFNGKGTFSSFYGGRYAFNSTVIKGKGTRKTVIIGEESIDELPGAFDVLQGSNVQLGYSSIELSDMHSFWVKSSAVDVNDKGNFLWDAFSSSNEFKKTDIKIHNGKISVKGKGAHGLYFYGLRPDEWFRMPHSLNEVLLQGKNIIVGKASVQLSETNLIVPEGIAIYSTGDKGFGGVATVELLENTRISGDLLLKTENVSSLLVQASASILKGAIHKEDRSRVDLQLKKGSTWYLTKSKYQDLQEEDAAFSSLSTLSLFDSTVVFEKYFSQDYHTLFIGNQIDNGDNIRASNNIGKTAGVDNVSNKVYRAEGNSQIQMSTFMNNDGSFDSLKTDLILIYGDVGGTTLISMERFQKDSEKKDSEEKVINGDGHQSVSIIQVFGKAKEDSFKLLSNYTAINGFPYQYKLRAYGPSSSSGEADPKNRLVAGEGDFWDFRIESVYVASELDSSKSVSEPTSTVLPPKSEVEMIASEQPTETILPEQSSSIDSSSVPSIVSLSEVSESSETFIPTDSVPTPSTPISPVPPSLPTVSENSSTEQSVPAPVVSVETSTDEVLSSEPSVPVSPSSPDFVPTPSASVETKSSTASDAFDPSSNLPMPLDIQPELGIRAVVPQLPIYLLLPNALFHAGLMDMVAQNKKLETMRNTFQSSWKEDEKTAFFLRAYGGNHHYTSNLSAFEYGYGAELDYNALEAGVLLSEIENLYSRTLFGALGTYGALSLIPQDVEQSKKSGFNKWSLAAYGSLQHDTGFYLDGVLSYGLFKGDVLTLARGKVVALKGKQFSGSFTSGKTFAIGYKGVVFDPQVQVTYQHLQFLQALDVDNIDVDLGKFHRWVGRVGGRLSKMLNVSEEGHVVSFYSKLSYLHSFEDKQFVSFKNDFQLGSFGSSLEAGLGFNARLSSKLFLHGDVIYQRRLKKAGFSGTSFSAELRYIF